MQAELKTPLCLDESIHSVDDARKALDLGSLLPSFWPLLIAAPVIVGTAILLLRKQES